jgi:hypothetical protein
MLSELDGVVADSDQGFEQFLCSDIGWGLGAVGLCRRFVLLWGFCRLRGRLLDKLHRYRLLNRLLGCWLGGSLFRLSLFGLRLR